MLKKPQDYPKRHLVCVSGATPQIITETLWALARAPEHTRLQPTDVTVITTELGASLIKENLLGNGGGLDRLYGDYPELSRPETFTVEVVKNDEGAGLKDIHSPEDSEALADHILSVMRRVTKDDNAAVHVSIAGGRKTMSFLAGYALSIFGRLQDRLSHVLVDPEFESCRDFWYPTPVPRTLVRELRDGDKQALDASEARVTLTDIPFVAMRYLAQDMPLLAQADLSYRKAVALMAMVASRRMTLELDMSNFRARILPLDEVLKLPKSNFMTLAWIAWTQTQSSSDEPSIVLDESCNGSLAESFCRFYSRFDNTSGEYTAACEALKVDPDSLVLIKQEKGMDAGYVRPKLTGIKNSARKLLGKELAETFFKLSSREGHGTIKLAIPDNVDIKWVETERG